MSGLSIESVHYFYIHWPRPKPTPRCRPLHDFSEVLAGASLLDGMFIYSFHSKLINKRLSGFYRFLVDTIFIVDRFLWSLFQPVKVQGDQLNMAVFFWYLEKSSLFKRYQKNTAMFNQSPCRKTNNMLFKHKDVWRTEATRKLIKKHILAHLS